MDQDPLPGAFHVPLVSEAEWRVLCCLDLEGGFVDDLGILALAEAIWVTDALPVADYEAATTQCLTRGWIKAITKKDRRAHMLRWEDDTQQTLREMLCRKGCLDFTLSGWQLFTQLVEIKSGKNLQQQMKACQSYLWGKSGQVSILSHSEEALLFLREQIMGGTDELMASALKTHHTLRDVTGPYPIELWWVTRFYQAPAGYRLDVVFTPARKRSRLLKPLT